MKKVKDTVHKESFLDIEEEDENEHPNIRPSAPVPYVDFQADEPQTSRFADRKHVHLMEEPQWKPEVEVEPGYDMAHYDSSEQSFKIRKKANPWRLRQSVPLSYMQANMASDDEEDLFD